MRLFSLLFPNSRKRLLSDLAVTITHRLEGIVWVLIHSRVEGMSRAEATGYIRSRAAGVIQSETAKALLRHARLRERDRALVLADVNRLVVESMLHGMTQARRGEIAARRIAA